MKTVNNGIWSLWKVGLLLYGGSLYAQQGYIRCGTMQHDSLMRTLYPDWPRMDVYEEAMKTRVQAYKSQMAHARTIGEVYRIPVVVHVIHNGEAVGSGSNISDAQIQSQIDVLNEDFRKKLGTPGWNNHPRGADVRIEFVLAKRDPSGNLTNGIVRWNRNSQGWAPPPYDMPYMDGTIKPATQWDPNRYLNIWVAYLSGGLLGYAQFPDLSGLLGMPGDAGMGACTQAANTDGVVILYSSFGSALKGTFPVLTSPYHMGRTTTHEVGHWLGLRHVWGDGDCTMDDFCDDTPLCNGQLYGCNAHPVTACNPSERRMIENYMEYSDDGCMSIFTTDQAVRMRIVLENCPRRRSLITSPALVPPATTDAAIINLPIPQDLCPGTYNFQATLRNNGTSNLTSVPISYRINNGSWQSTTWTGSLAGGATTLVTLSGLNFTTVGDYTLTVCSSLAGDPNPTEDTVTTRFKVHDGFYPLFEDFEAYEGRAFPASLWRVNNPDNDCYTWRPGHCVGSNGQRTTAMFVNIWGYNPGSSQRDELYTPIIDLTGAPAGVTLTFNVAYRRYDNTSTDELRVEISTDCGATWNATPIYQKSGNTLATAGNTTTRYIPAAAGEWRTETVNFSAYAGQKIRLRFVTINQFGNNIWIDNVRITHLPFVFFREIEQTIREELTWPPLFGDCRRYKDINIPVYISAAPSANVTVSVGLGSSASAYDPGDVEILTPTLTFPAGSATPQTLTFRVYDDDAIESQELAPLTLTMGSGPAIVDPQRSTHKLWIEDNDFFPPEVILFKEDFESGGTGWTTVNVTAGTNQWVVGAGAGMGGTNAAYITSNPAGSPPPHQYATNSTSRVALVSPAISTLGATNLVLAFDVKVNGQYNGGNLLDFGRLFYSTIPSTTGFQPVIGCAWTNNTCLLASEQPRSYQLYGHPEIRRVVVSLPTAAENQPNVWLAWRWDNDATGGAQPPLAIDNIVLYGRRMPSVENALTTTRAYFGPYDSIYVYSPSGKLIVSLKNTGTHDYACLDVQIDRVGTSAQALRPGHTPPQYVTDKTFLITPANNSTTNAYRIRLYYTNTEKAGWESTTGNTWSSQGYGVKATGSIPSEYSAPSPTYTMDGVITGSLGSDWWAQGTFTSFSGFAVGAPPPLYRVGEKPGSATVADGRFYAENPWSGRLRVWCGEAVGTLRLWNLDGRLLWQTQEARMPAGWHEVHLPEATAGVYLMEWVSPEGLTVYRQKLWRLP